MNEHIIVGSMTLPYSLSDKGRLLWLEDWVLSSARGTNAFDTIVEVVFSFEDDINESIKWLLSWESGWHLIGPNKFMAPNGTMVMLYYDEQAEHVINQLRND